MSPVIDPLELRRDLAAYPTGVVAICALNDGAPVGMAVNSFTSISLDPPIVSASGARSSRTWPILAKPNLLGLSVLGETQEAFCRQLSSQVADRFAGAVWRGTANGAVHVDGAALWMDCGIRSIV